MKSIIKFSIKNKLAILIMTLMVIAGGIFSGTQMKMETLPDISIPVLLVSTVNPGASAEDIVESITEPLEMKLSGLEGLKTVSSTSMSNMSMLQLEYEYGVDMERAVLDVEEVLRDVKLPEGVKSPDVNRISMDNMPVYLVGVMEEGKSNAELSEKLETTVIPKLEKIDGISNLTVSGKEMKEINMKWNEEKLNEIGMSKSDVKGYVQAAITNMPLGLFNFADEERVLVIDGNYSTLEDLKGLELPGKKITLGELAEFKEVSIVETISRTNGEPSLSIQVTKSPDANTVSLVNEVKEILDDSKKSGLEYVTLLDMGDPIEASVKQMLSKAIIGALAAMIVILFFLRDYKSTLIAVISIPMSLLIGLIILNQMGISLNIMTLGAMTVAIGRVIDDSIVVIENIYRRLNSKDEKLKGKELIIDSTKEVFIPILSSTLVTIAVFLPLGLVGGQVGELFLPFALTVVFALLASLLVAITIVPVMANNLFKKDEKEHVKKQSKLVDGYIKALKWTLNHKIITFGLSILMLVGSLFLIPLVGTSFLPAEESKVLTISYKPASGETKEHIEEIGLSAEKYFMGNEEITSIHYTIEDGNMFSAGTTISYTLEFDEDTENFEDVPELLVSELIKLDGDGVWSQQSMMTGSSNSVSVLLKGNSMEDVSEASKLLVAEMKKNNSLTKVKSDMEDSIGQYRLVVDKEKASQFGITSGQIAMSIIGNVNREVFTTVLDGRSELEVVIDEEKTIFKGIDEVTDLGLMETPVGKISIGDVANIVDEKSFSQITRKDGDIYASVSAEIKGNDIGKVTKVLKEDLEDLKLPEGVSHSFGGVSEQMEESFIQLGLAILAAILIVYLILVITFHEGTAPFAILFSLPFTIIGSLVGLYVMKETISVSVMLGLLMLIGIVVTNAIVLVDKVIHKETEGLNTRDSLLEAASIRLRPILMTAIATIGALLPLALGSEGSGLISKGLGITVIGGLISSTLLTLVIVPLVYEVLRNRQSKKRERKLKKKNAENLG